MDVSIINPWGTRQPFFFAQRYVQINQLKLLCFQKNKQTSIWKICNFTVNRDETTVVAYTCRYSSGKLIPIFQSVVVAELGIKGPLEYLQVQATTLVSLLFIYMIPIDCKITNFSFTYL